MRSFIKSGSVCFWIKGNNNKVMLHFAFFSEYLMFAHSFFSIEFY